MDALTRIASPSRRASTRPMAALVDARSWRCASSSGSDPRNCASYVPTRPTLVLRPIVRRRCRDAVAASGATKGGDGLEAAGWSNRDELVALSHWQRRCCPRKQAEATTTPQRRAQTLKWPDCLAMGGRPKPQPWKHGGTQPNIGESRAPLRRNANDVPPNRWDGLIAWSWAPLPGHDPVGACVGLHCLLGGCAFCSTATRGSACQRSLVVVLSYGAP